MSRRSSAAGTPPRVLLVTKGLDIGGIERIVVDLALGLKRRNVAVEVAVINDGRDQLAGQIEQAGVTLHRLGGSDSVGPRAAWRLLRLLRSGRYDVIHVHGPLPAVVARCVPGAPPVVTTSHTLWSGLRRSTRALSRVTAFRDAATLAVSSVVAQSLPRRVAEHTRLMPHGVDMAAIERARATSQPPQNRPSARDAEVAAITVASHRDVKNYPNLLRALEVARARGARIHLTAVGDGPERERHRELAAELGIADAVSFVPATTMVLNLMAASDLLIVASDFEGQPMVVMEAMALGLPVVATAVGRVPELLSPSEGRMVAPGDSEALGAALVEVATDAGLRQRLGDQARTVSGSWTLDQVIDAHLALYGLVC